VGRVVSVGGWGGSVGGRCCGGCGRAGREGLVDGAGGGAPPVPAEGCRGGRLGMPPPDEEGPGVGWGGGVWEGGG